MVHRFQASSVSRRAGAARLVDSSRKRPSLFARRDRIIDHSRSIQPRSLNFSDKSDFRARRHRRRPRRARAGLFVSADRVRQNITRQTHVTQEVVVGSAPADIPAGPGNRQVAINPLQGEVVKDRAMNNEPVLEPPLGVPPHLRSPSTRSPRPASVTEAPARLIDCAIHSRT